MFHECANGEPEAIAHGEIGAAEMLTTVDFVFPFIAVEPIDQEENDADAEQDADDTHPNFEGQGAKEGGEPWYLLLWYFNHDTDARTHKRFGEMDHFFTSWCYSQRCERYICFLGRYIHTQMLYWMVNDK